MDHSPQNLLVRARLSAGELGLLIEVTPASAGWTDLALHAWVKGTWRETDPRVPVVTHAMERDEAGLRRSSR